MMIDAMAESKAGTTVPAKFTLRLPRQFLGQIQECASFSGRSVNAEMLHLVRLGILAEARYREAAEKLLAGAGE